MATATLTPDQDVVLAEIFIAAPPERVFQAITDPSQRRQWWGEQGFYRTTEAYSDLRPGGKWLSKGVMADGTAFHVEGEYLEVDPPRRLIYTWRPSWTEPFDTTVAWELEPREVHGLQHRGPHRMGIGTLVKIRHEGFAGHPREAANHGEGWKRSLGWLQAFAEKGETIDTRTQSA
jgi:uncharacterized protein YndB with AHSA1/START domain